MSAHTEGPWKTGTKGHGRFCVYAQNAHRKGVCMMSNIQTSWREEQVAKYGEHPLNLEAAANATLISAAPDMLTALQQCDAQLGYVNANFPGDRGIERALSSAREAINKATNQNHDN